MHYSFGIICGKHVERIQALYLDLRHIFRGNLLLLMLCTLKTSFFFLKRSLEISCVTTVELIIVHQRFSSQMLTNGSYFWLDNNH